MFLKTVNLLPRIHIKLTNNCYQKKVSIFRFQDLITLKLNFYKIFINVIFKL